MPKSTPESVPLFIYESLFTETFEDIITILLVYVCHGLSFFYMLVLLKDLHENPYLMDAALLFPYLLHGLNNAHVS